jgi:two-component system sensor histidine kinase TorS
VLTLLVFSLTLLMCPTFSEIRTPIHGIIATAQLLETSALLNEEQLDYVQIIGRSARALLSIINSILDFSKIEAGRLDLDIACFDVHQTP